MSVARALFKPREERTVQATPWGQWQGDNVTNTWAGASVDEQSALQLLTVYGCAAFIVDGITTLPLDEYRNTPDGKIEQPKPAWLERPTADLDFPAWAGQILTSLLLAGNAYCFMRYDAGVGLRELIPIDPTKVVVRREGARKVFVIGGKVFTASDVWHIPGLMFPGSDVGLSPVEMARQTIGSGMSAEEFAGNFYSKGATLSGVIEVPGTLDNDQAKVWANSWRRAHSGASKAHLPGVLSGGAQWKPTGVTNEQSQFLETRKFTAAQIAGLMFRIDPAELGIPIEGTSLTYTNQEQRNIRKVQVTFLPWIVRLENAISALLARPRYVKFNVEGLLRGDVKTRFETYRIAAEINTSAVSMGMAPVLTTDEMREFEDYAPLEPGLFHAPATSAPANDL